MRLSTSSPSIPILITHFPAPHTYTGDDLAEIQCPGNPALLERIIHRCIDHGARLAEPGEFTCRAYLAGKLDLPRAEGVAATIAAASDGQLHAARLLRDGKLGDFAAALVDDLANTLALVEAGIDFTDQEDVVAIAPDDLQSRLQSMHQRVQNLLSRSRSWGSLEALPRVVLVGAPSTGKSTLFNALLGRDRTIISEQPGTTRDVIAEPMRLGDTHEIMLVDIAGLDEPTTALDHDVQDHARRAIESADLILNISDAPGAPGTPKAACGLALFKNPTLHIHTKSDLTPAPPGADLSVSAHTGAGLDDLRRLIADRLTDRPVSLAADMLALQPRHESALRAAADHLSAAVAPSTPGADELTAAAMRAALDELAGLGGQITPDDVIGRIFASFCIGK